MIRTLAVLQRRLGVFPGSLKTYFKALLAAACWTACLVPCCFSARGDDLALLEEQAFRAAVDRVAGAVVEIETVGGLERVENVLFGTGSTTGLVVDPDGYILSSAFAFLNQPTSILVRLPDGSRRPARRVATDHNRLVVLLKIDVDEPLPVPEVARRDQMRVGAWAITVGRTFEGDRPNLAVGVVSALSRIWGKAIQTDAAVSPGNYGGPLVDVHGRVLGLVVPLSPQQGETVAGVHWYDSGIGFAVPLCDLLEILGRLKEGEDLYPGVTGLGFPREALYTSSPVIEGIRRGSPADKAGLEKGDQIVAIGGRPVARPADVREEIGRRYAGDKLKVVVLRGDKRLEREIELVAALPAYVPPFLGILPAREASADDRTAAGVIVRYVYPGGPAEKAGIEPGDAIIRFAGEPIQDADELRRRVAVFLPREQVELEIRRGTAIEKRSVQLARLPEALPPPALPPAATRPAAGDEDRAGRGRIRLKIPEFENRAWAYVPENYDPAVPHGVVAWLHAPGQWDADALISEWKPHCEQDHLILLAPASADPDAWRTTEIELVARLLGEIASAYVVDRDRVVVAGQDSGGTLAYLVAFRERDRVRAVAAVDAPLGDRPPEYDPDQPLAVYAATSGESPFAGVVDEGLALLRAGNYPVTVKPLGEEPRPLAADELAELARWIDMLDRI